MNAKLEIFLGEATDVEARVYFRLSGSASPDVLCLRGKITGPFCQYAHTLPAQVSLRPFASEGLVQAEAILPDPCSWTPAMPFLYRAEVEFQDGERGLQQVERLVGIRRLGCHGPNLFLDGRRHVLRGAVNTSVEVVDLAPWHDAQLAMVACNPDDALCEEASRCGVLLIADLRGFSESPESLTNTLSCLARWPAVGVAILPSDLLVFPRNDCPPNLLLGQVVSTSKPCTPASWADLLVCEEAATPIARGLLPILAYRPHPRLSSPAEARAACDRLQRDLAPGIDAAGYFVF